MASLTFYDDPAAFLAAAGDHLAADPVLSTVVATIAERSAREDRDGVAAEVPFRWWVVAYDDDGRVAGTGMRTAPFAPYPLFLLPMSDHAARDLARTLHARGEHVGGVNGALPASRVCAEELARLQGGTAEVEVHTRLHRLDQLRLPRPAPGRLRVAEESDVDLALEWFEAFGREADEQAGRPAGSLHEMTDTEVTMLRRIREQRVWFWVDDEGHRVHLTGINEPAFGAARIGPVYTPPEHRGRGYAGNTVALLSRHILDAGHRPCLFTDQANPTSNQLYAGLGYEPVVDMVFMRVR